jgi:hypothetical protein
MIQLRKKLSHQIHNVYLGFSHTLVVGMWKEAFNQMHTKSVQFGDSNQLLCDFKNLISIDKIHQLINSIKPQGWKEEKFNVFFLTQYHVG